MVPVREPLLLFGRERKNCGGGCVEMKKLCEVEVEGEEERKEGDWKIFQISKT
jgi:hypothetical protein|tara:strand:- start:394 stop:552 length:159 start_codon:yes stop_codon:yes gene_type:complete